MENPALAVERLRQSCVFSTRLTTDQDLTRGKDDDSYRIMNQCLQVYRASPYFKPVSCRYKAPVDGDYSIGMGICQSDDKGGLEIILSIGKFGNYKQIYMGNTDKPKAVCHKNVILSLKAGDTVIGAVKRSTKTPDVVWCSFDGFLISPSELPSSSTYPTLPGQNVPSAPSN